MHRFLIGPAVLLSSCQVVSLPPAASRVDGGPVATRGVVSHEARSSLRLYQDAAGCESVQAMNRQFRLVTVRGNQGPERLVLEEAYDVRLCLASASGSTEATITAWRPDSGAKPAFVITARAAEGSPMGNLYQLATRGCCGSGKLLTFYSLRTGRLLLATSHSPLTLVAPTGAILHLGLHDTFSAGTPPEAAADSTVIGVLQWADEDRPLGRVVIRSEKPGAFAVGGLFWTRNGRRAPDSLRQTNPATPIALGVELASPGAGRVIRITVPIDSLGLAPRRATTPADIRLTREP